MEVNGRCPWELTSVACGRNFAGASSRWYCPALQRITSCLLAGFTSYSTSTFTSFLNLRKLSYIKYSLGKLVVGNHSQEHEMNNEYQRNAVLELLVLRLVMPHFHADPCAEATSKQG